MRRARERVRLCLRSECDEAEALDSSALAAAGARTARPAAAWAGTTDGARTLRAAFDYLGSTPLTRALAHLNGQSHAIDHLAVSHDLLEERVEVHRSTWPDGRDLSDHAAYTAEVHLPRA